MVQLDVSDEDSILASAKALEGETIDLLINNAGINIVEMLEDTKKGSLMKQLEVNAVGPFLVTRASREHLKRASAVTGLAKVASVSSFVGSITLNDEGQLFPPGGGYGYRSSKAALNMINRSLSFDLKDDKIATVVCHPGYVATDMTEGYEPTLQPEDSVAGMVRVIEKVTLGESGTFFGENGEILPW